MQIQLVIGEQDSRYLNQLLLFLEKNHMDQLEIVSFSRPEMLLDYFTHGKADIILVDEQFGVDLKELTKYGKTACLCDVASEEKGDGIRQIAKYKKPDLIFKDILDLYAESGKRQRTFRGKKSSGQMVLVTGFSGGTGASTFAAALARKYASYGKRTLYLNLETVGSSRDFFSGTGNYRFEDVIFALKSRRADVRLKMESSVRQDKCGVFYFEPCDTAMYMLELTHGDMIKILDVVSETGSYDFVVVDMNFKLSGECLEILDRMDRIVLVEDGSETANSKFQRTMEALLVMEEQENRIVTDRMCVLYNRFSSSKSSSELLGLKIPVVGKFPPIKHALVQEIIGYMIKDSSIFENL